MLLKRSIDIVLSASLLLLLSPVLVAVAVAVWLDSGRPVLFRQPRVGLRFRRFDILKFRTMRVQTSGHAITVAGDRRITRVGRLLRVIKFDELPQFWNVLCGDMSLVGPRPEVPKYVELFKERYRSVLTVRPGITDLATIHFRNEEEVLSNSAAPLTEYAERILPAKLDWAEEYVKTHTLLGDFFILVRTALAVVGRLPALNWVFIRWISQTDRSDSARRFLIIITHCSIFAFSAVIAFFIRFEFGVPRDELRHLYTAIVVWVVIKIFAFRIAGLNRGWWRFVSIHDLGLLASANGIASTIGFVVISLSTPGFPRSIYIIDLLICFLSTCGIRVIVRMLMEAGIQIQRAGAGKRVLIYGAGIAGQALLREIRSNSQLVFQVCGFLDDDIRKRGLSIQGVRVLGTGGDLADLAATRVIDEVLVAIPSASGSQMAAILKRCHQAKVSCKTIPSLGDLAESNSLASQIRDVAVEDLLARTPVSLQEEQIRDTLEGKVVLVTGAAGSIGSELCRQIARFRPAGIVGFDIAESPLFEIDREMRQGFPHVPFFSEIGSIQNRARIDEVLRRHRPSAIYHTAAYKHVPLMEAHVFEAIENNIFGTYNIAEAAAKHGVADFLLVSSDKAVRPTNVMGATKRVAELLLLALQNGRTKFVAVRFGNVLGSNGSVIPIFKKQIAAGGPVTVTHPEMRRFFMTIPEACQLVLQAAVMGKGGQICVLDMGQPVKIVDLARNLILLSGLRPDEDIKIEFTGMRPGEKLYEELNTLLEDTVPTTHEKIRIFVGDGMPADDIQSWLALLHEICVVRDTGRLVLALKELVWDYNPSTYLLKDMIGPPKIPPVAVAINWQGTRDRTELPDISEARIRLSALGD
jgi:FlaA1/EpsC-like NDP-sugar epimerase/lipopolysaccharide/colanic/teichoic acid biosynthesis glycosyltransferase